MALSSLGGAMEEVEILLSNSISTGQAVQKSGNSIQGLRFHFEEWWANDQDCEEIVSRMWRGNEAGDEVSLLLSKLRELRILPRFLKEALVRDFILPTRAWDVDKIKACFSAADSEAILGLPLSLRQCKDS
ncbi:hypothetical protein ACOSQ3_021832 [Xanthoceras sorbifolium]